MNIETHVDQIKDIKQYITSIERPQGINILYLCGGIGTFAQAMKEAHVQVAHHIDVEIDQTSRRIAAKNHRIDHTSLPQDITQITK